MEKLLKKTDFVVLVDGRPYCTLVDKSTVTVVCMDARKAFPKGVIMVVQHDARDITHEFDMSDRGDEA